MKMNFHFLTSEFSFRPNDNYAAKPQYDYTLANQARAPKHRVLKVLSASVLGRAHNALCALSSRAEREVLTFQRRQKYCFLWFCNLLKLRNLQSQNLLFGPFFLIRQW